ncbi:MAG: AraC family transcriptional regulator [Myxococcota bacterium]
MHSYQDVYPEEPIIRSGEKLRPKAASLLTLEFFEAEPATMPSAVFAQHQVLINLKREPMRVENWRDGVHRDFTYKQNEVVLTPAGVESGWRWYERSKVIVITLEPKRLESFAQSEMGMILTDQQLRDLPQFEDPDLAAAAVMLRDSLELGQGASDVMFESLARVFLVKLLTRYGAERSREEHSESYTAGQHRRLLSRLERDFGEPLTVESLASTVGLSPSHFSRVFKSVVGDSPHQFLIRYRVERAKEMLADPGRPLIDIALACGFSDQPHLTRAFKRLQGTTPKKWRAGDHQSIK